MEAPMTSCFFLPGSTPFPAFPAFFVPPFFLTLTTTTNDDATEAADVAAWEITKEYYL